ncbi:MAG: hypothetical protein K2X87_04130 [Gemmataceae bacterium]|nr:hypothetical protein [Gemmataceae bacterium]
MKITLYTNTYPVKDAPVAYSLVPFPPHQRHTYTRDGQVYDAVGREVSVTVPDGAVVDADRRLCWTGDQGKVRSSAGEVYAFVQAKAPGFGS